MVLTQKREIRCTMTNKFDKWLSHCLPERRVRSEDVGEREQRKHYSCEEHTKIKLQENIHQRSLQHGRGSFVSEGKKAFLKSSTQKLFLMESRKLNLKSFQFQLSTSLTYNPPPTNHSQPSIHSPIRQISNDCNAIFFRRKPGSPSYQIEANSCWTFGCDTNCRRCCTREKGLIKLQIFTFNYRERFHSWWGGRGRNGVRRKF